MTRALVIAALKAGIDGVANKQRILYEIPFDSERKTMSVVVSKADGSVMYTKGAPEVVIGKCISELRDGRVEPLTEARREAILQAAMEMASRALRVLGLACREHPNVQRLLGHDLLQLAVLALKLREPLHVADFHATVLRLPAIKRLLRDVVLAADVACRHPALGFLQDPNDLLLRTSLLHGLLLREALT